MFALFTDTHAIQKQIRPWSVSPRKYTVTSRQTKTQSNRCSSTQTNIPATSPSQFAANIVALLAKRQLLQLISNEVQVYLNRSAEQVRHKNEGGTPKVKSSKQHSVHLLNILLLAHHFQTSLLSTNLMTLQIQKDNTYTHQLSSGEPSA